MIFVCPSQVLLPFPRYVYGRMVLSGEVKDDHDQPIPNQMPTEMLVIELLDDFQVIDKKVGVRTHSRNSVGVL